MLDTCDLLDRQDEQIRQLKKSQISFDRHQESYYQLEDKIVDQQALIEQLENIFKDIRIRADFGGGVERLTKAALAAVSEWRKEQGK